MARRQSRHGTTYNVGSTSSYAGWEPRECAFGADCLHGGRIVKSHDHALQFYWDAIGERGLSWHRDCSKRFGLARLGLGTRRRAAA